MLLILQGNISERMLDLPEIGSTRAVGISRRKMLVGAALSPAIGAPLGMLTEATPADATASLQFSTVASLVAHSSSGLTNQITAAVLNYASTNDRGGGTFIWNASSTAAHDNGVVFCPSDKLGSVNNLFMHICNGIATTYGNTLVKKSLRPGTLVVYAGPITARDNGSGTIYGPGAYGTVNYTTGAWSVTYAKPPAAYVSISLSYQYATSPGRWVRQLSSTMNLDAFGPDGFSAWYTAFHSTGNSVKILEVAAGTHYINRAAFAGTGALLVVPNGMTILLDAGAQVSFDHIEEPLFCFLGNTSGGMSGGIFRYTGGMPNYQTPALTKTQFLNYPGIGGKGLTLGQQCDAYCLIYSNSSNMLFNGCDVQSANPNSESHILPTIIYMHPTNKTTNATNNIISNMTWRDFQQGWIGYGQTGMTLTGINADRRAGLTLKNGSTAYGPGPGHVFYSNDTYTWGGLLMRNCTISNIYDGPNPINYPASNVANMYTLSPKSMTGCTFDGVVSQHPLGIMVLISTSYTTFKNFTWNVYDSSFIRGNAYGVKATYNSSSDNAGNNNIFTYFTVNAPKKPFQVWCAAQVAFNNNSFSNFNIACNNAILTGSGIFDFTGNHNTFSNISITPGVKAGYSGMVAVAARGTSTGNSGIVTILGPNAGPALVRFVQGNQSYPNSVKVTT